MPFIVRAPRIAPAVLESNVLLSTIDIYPTLCALAGLKVPDHCRGRDLSRAVVDFEHRADVGMIQRRGRFGFALEPFADLRI